VRLHRPPQAGDVEAVQPVVVGHLAVDAVLGAVDAEREQPQRPVPERLGDEVAARAAQPRLHHDHLGTQGRRAQCGDVERAHRHRVQDGDLEALGGREDAVEHRPDGDDEATTALADDLPRGPGDVRGTGVGRRVQAHVDAVLPREGAPQDRLDLRRVAGRVHRPAVERVEQGDVARPEVRRPAGRPAVRAARGDQHGADALVAQVELHLLEGTLHQEGREGVHERSQPRQRQAAGGAQEQLLADADVDHARGERLRDVDVPGSDRGEHDDDPLVLGQQPGQRRVEGPALVHGRGRSAHRSPPSTRATTAWGRVGSSSAAR